MEELSGSYFAHNLQEAELTQLKQGIINKPTASSVAQYCGNRRLLEV